MPAIAGDGVMHLPPIRITATRQDGETPAELVMRLTTHINSRIEVINGEISFHPGVIQEVEIRTVPVKTPHPRPLAPVLTYTVEMGIPYLIGPPHDRQLRVQLSYTYSNGDVYNYQARWDTDNRELLVFLSGGNQSWMGHSDDIHDGTEWYPVGAPVVVPNGQQP